MTNTDKMQTVFVTKYWQTKGIYEIKAKIWTSDLKGRLYAKPEGPAYFDSLRLDHEAFLDRTKAEMCVQVLAAKKIKSLRKQLAKLEAAYPEATKVDEDLREYLLG